MNASIRRETSIYLYICCKEQIMDIFLETIDKTIVQTYNVKAIQLQVIFIDNKLQLHSIITKNLYVRGFRREDIFLYNCNYYTVGNR